MTNCFVSLAKLVEGLVSDCGALPDITKSRVHLIIVEKMAQSILVLLINNKKIQFRYETDIYSDFKFKYQSLCCLF